MVSVQLSNKSEYQKFDNILNENIINKKGRCLFPSPAFSVTGMESADFYQIFLTFKQVGNRMVYTNKKWEPIETAEGYEEQSVQYGSGAATGLQIMTNIIEFPAIRLTNSSEKANDKNIILLNSMHQYLPVLKVQQVKVNVNGEWEKVDDEPMEFSFDETTFLATTKYKNDAICELKSTMNKFSSAVQKRKREESGKESNQGKRRCVEQEIGTTKKVDRLPSTPGENDVSRTNEGVNSTSGFNSMHQDQLPVINPNDVTRPNCQQEHTSESSHPSTSTAHRQDKCFANHQVSNLPTNQFNVNNASYQSNNTGFHFSTTVPPAQQYPQPSFPSTNANQLNLQNYQPGPYHPNTFSTAHYQNNHRSTSFSTTPAQRTFQHPSHATNDNQFYRQINNPGSYYQNAVPTLQHQLNASAPSQPTVINQMNFPNYTLGDRFPNTNTPFPHQSANANQLNYPDYTCGATYPNVSSLHPSQHNVPTTIKHFENAVPAMYNPTPPTNNLPYNPSQVNYQNPSWLNNGFSTSQPQQTPHNFDQQLQWPQHY